MLRLGIASLSLSLVGCSTLGERAASGECPAGEECSPLTPNGLHFVGNAMADEIFVSGPSATAIGGTQEIKLEYERANGLRQDLNLPYEADDDGALGVSVVATDGPVVTVRGERSRKNYLRIVDPDTGELYDRYEIAGAAIEDMYLVGTELEAVPVGRELVWAPGDQRIGVALVGEVQDGNDNELQRIVDASMILGLAGSERVGWDELRLDNATVGVHTLTIEAGDLPMSALPVEVVAGADTIELIGDPPVIAPNGSASLCFEALHQERYIYGLTWQFNVDGVATTHGKQAVRRNCITVEAGAVSGTIAVAAAAGGQQANIDVIVSTSLRVAGEAAPAVHTTLERSVTTEGDRARM